MTENTERQRETEWERNKNTEKMKGIREREMEGIFIRHKEEVERLFIQTLGKGEQKQNEWWETQ